MNCYGQRAVVVALALTVLAFAACSGTPPQEQSTPSPTLSSEHGPRQVEAGAPLGDTTTGDPAEEPPKPEAEVVFVGKLDIPAVALTFDTGTPPGYVRQILDVLKKHHKRASFAVTGQWSAANPDLLKRIVKEGHAVINHSWSHASFTGEDTESEPLTAEQIREELRRTEEKVQQVAGVSTRPYFRPPYGDYDRRVSQVAREEGYRYNVLWLVDGMGWAGRSTKSIVAVTLANAYNGAIFLYHTDNGQEYRALEEIIEGLDERGLMMVTIPQLLGKEPMPTPTATPSATPKPTATSVAAKYSGPRPASQSAATPTPRPASTRAAAPTPTLPPTSTPTATATSTATATATPSPTATATPAAEAGP